MGQQSEGKEKAKGNQKSGGKQKHTTTEDGPEMLRLQRSRVQGYLSKVLAKRAEMSAPLQKPFVPWRCPESYDLPKKKKPLVHLDENASKTANKHSKELQKRHLELAVASCLALCKRNTEGMRDIDRGDKGDLTPRCENNAHPKESTSRTSSVGRRSTGRRTIARANTAALKEKLSLNNRFSRRGSAELLRKRSQAKIEIKQEEQEESAASETSEADVPHRKRKGADFRLVKKTGRKRGRPRLSQEKESKVKATNIRIKKKTNNKVVERKRKILQRIKKKAIRTQKGGRGKR